MDTRFFGSNLLALNEVRADRRRLSTEAGEDAYYTRHTPANGRVASIASVAATVLFGFVTIGAWLQ